MIKSVSETEIWKRNENNKPLVIVKRKIAEVTARLWSVKVTPVKEKTVSS